jgi:hypothetical protein
LPLARRPPRPRRRSARQSRRAATRADAAADRHARDLQGQAFRARGRLQRGWDGGFWSEWHALFGGRDSAWLAQAQGNYYLTFPADLPSKLKSPSLYEGAEPGTRLEINGTEFTVADRKSSEIASYEGELPAGAIRKGRLQSIDLTSTSDAFATVELASGQEAAVYVGVVGPFEAFAFQNLKAIDGW